MPTKDENSLFPDFNLGETRAILRGDDAREFVLPGSIPSISDLSDGEDPEEHNCLPPLEALTTDGWLLSDRLAGKLLDAIESFEEAGKKCPQAVIVKTVNDFSEELEAEGIIMPPAMIENSTSYREMRRFRRWNEKNRRRRLKGLPEKQNPYPRACSFTYIINLRPPEKIPMTFVLDGEEK